MKFSVAKLYISKYLQVGLNHCKAIEWRRLPSVDATVSFEENPFLPSADETDVNNATVRKLISLVHILYLCVNASTITIYITINHLTRVKRWGSPSMSKV